MKCKKSHFTDNAIKMILDGLIMIDVPRDIVQGIIKKKMEYGYLKQNKKIDNPLAKFKKDEIELVLSFTHNLLKKHAENKKDLDMLKQWIKQ